MATYVNVNGTAMALNTYSGEGSLANLTDSNKTTLWHSNDANESTWNGFCGITFSTDQNVAKIEIDFARWGSKIVIGFAAAKPATSAGFVVVRTIDTNVTPNDDLGVPWGSDRSGKRTNTILLPGTVAAKCWGIINLDNNASPLSDGPTSNTRLTVYEVAMYKDTDAVVGGPPLVKITGTGIASSQFNDFGLIAAINDGNTGTGWSGGGVGAGAVADWAALQFAAPVVVKKVEAMFYSWGKTIVIGYTSNVPGSKADFTVVRTIDITVTTSDDLGVPWSRLTVNTISLPTNTVAAAVWGIYTNDTGPGVLGFNGGSLDRTRIMELNMYGEIQTVNNGLNPKPPASAPVIPYNAATPAGWTKTIFTAAGDYNFTPAADTTMLLAIGAGAGAGGRINVALNGDETPLLPNLNGGDTIITGPNGVLLNSGGGKLTVAGLVNARPSDIYENWWRYIDHGAGNGLSTTQGTIVSAAGTQSTLGGVRATALSLAVAQTNAPFTALNTNFNGAAAIPVTPSVFTNFTRHATYGWQSTNTEPLSVARLSFTMKGYTGQRVTFRAYKYSTVATSFNLFCNGVQVYSVGGGGNTSYDMPFNFTTTGDQLITFEFTRADVLPSVQGFVGIYQLNLDYIGYGPTTAGAAGRTQAAFIPVAPVSFTVGKGGIGQPGGQNVTAAQNGVQAGGGAAGGNGGDGVVIFYEYKGTVNFEKPVEPVSRAQLNVSVTEVTGWYRTQYNARSYQVDGLQSVYKHKLRPRTKRVLAYITGAGGSSWVGWNATQPSGSTTISTTKRSYTAGGGFSSFMTQPNNNRQRGLGGTFSSATEPLFFGNGAAGGSDSSSDAAPDNGTVNGYGAGTPSWYLSSAGGGAGAWAIVAFGDGDFNDDRTIDLFVGNALYNVSNNNIGQPGAIFIYETESEFGPYISQTADLMLLKTGLGDTATSQTSEMILRKDGLVGSNITQTAELLLLKDSDVNDLQVSYMNIAFVYEADDPRTAVSQTAQQLLLKSQTEKTQVSQAAELILMRSEYLPFRITQTVEMFFVAEEPSVLWLNFGTLEYPVKNQLYTSSTGRATSVKPDAYLQLEGSFAPGTTMFINGVDVGLSAPLHNNDQVYIHGGVTNYWQTFINAYVYYTTNGEITREQAGTWKIVQPVLTAVKPRSYGAYTTFTWLKTAHGFAISGLIPQVVKANSVYGKFVEYLAQKVSYAASSLTSEFVKAAVSTFESYTEALMQKANSQIAEVTLVPEFTKNNSLIAEVTVDWEAVKTKDVYVTVGYDEVSKAHIVYTDVTGYEDTKAGYGTYIVSDAGFDLIQTGDGFYTIVESEIAKAGYADYKIEEADIAKAYYGKTDQEFIHVYRDHAYYSDVVYTAISNSGATATFPMGWFGTIAYSVLTGMEYQVGVTIGTGHWYMPLGNALYAKAGFGYANMPVPDKTIAHSELYGVAVEKHGAHENGYFSTTGYVHSIGIATFETEVLYSGVHSDTGSVSITPIKTIHHSSNASLTPYRYEQSPNGRGAASLYMGFDTKQDALDFTQNFYGVTTIAMYNGFVYNLEIDKSFVCEIYYNGPVSGLIQGG